MSNIDYSTIPKDLPKTNPLLFSFWAIIEASKMNLKIDGIDARNFEKDVPAFQYAVQSWRIITQKEQGRKYPRLEQDVVCAIWTDTPLEGYCEYEWDKKPNGEETRKKDRVDYLYRFEKWKNEQFDNLDAILSHLVEKNDNSVKRDADGKKLVYIADIFDFAITNNTIQYLYVKNATANQYFGIGASFTLQSSYYSCCPKIDQNKLTLSFLQSIGFDFSTP